MMPTKRFNWISWGAAAALSILSCAVGDEAPPVLDAPDVADSPEAQQVVDRLRSFRLAVMPAPAGAEPGLEGRARPLLADAVAVGFDERLTPRLAPGALAAVAQPARVTLAARASEPFEVTDLHSGLSMRVALEGASGAPAERAGGYLVYRGADASGGDVIHRASATGTEDYVVYDEPPPSSAAEYTLALGEEVAGLRLVGSTLELLDEAGAPRLRMAPPYLVDADGQRHEVAVAVEGCAVDTDPRAPWNRPVTDPGAPSCRVHLGWDDDVAYPAVLDPAWNTTGSLSTVRQDDTATLLSDGRVIAAGGHDGTTVFASSEIYDPITGVWAATGAMSFPRRLHAAAPLSGDRALVAGGFNGGYLTSAEVYEVLTGQWAPVGSLTTARHSPAVSVLLDGRVLVAGGQSSSAILGSVEIFNPASNSWTATGAMNQQRAYPSGTTLTDGRVLVAGGNGTNANQTAETWSSGTGTWTPTGALGAPRFYPVASRLNDGRVLLAGGYSTGALETSSCEIYNPGTNQWSGTGAMSRARASHTTTTLGDGTVLAAGGTGDPFSSTTAEIYNPSTGLWTNTNFLHDGHVFHTANLLDDGRVLVAGGGVTTTELYGPSVFVSLNEIRVDQPNADDDEYVELTGAPGTSLNGMSLLVIGDGSSGSGTVEAVVPLGGNTIGASGRFVIAESTFTLGSADLFTSLNFENADNVTFFLVDAFSGSSNQDLDTNDDCVLDATPWAFIRSSVALLADSLGGDCVYTANTVGPYASATPGSAFRCPDTSGGWFMGTLAVGTTDTPGDPNACGAPGDGCTATNECTSGFCVDSVCCDAACGNGAVDCQACDVTGLEGTCSPVPSGTSCGDATDDACTNPDACNATGTCLANDEAAGAPCGDQAVDCHVDDTCDGSGVCADAGLEPEGSACDNGQCDASGTCDPSAQGGAGGSGGGGNATGGNATGGGGNATGGDAAGGNGGGGNAAGGNGGGGNAAGGNGGGGNAAGGNGTGGDAAGGNGGGGNAAGGNGAGANAQGGTVGDEASDDDETSDTGCSCRIGTEPASSAWWALGLLGLLLHRRRPRQPRRLR